MSRRLSEEAKQGIDYWTEHPPFFVMARLVSRKRDNLSIMKDYFTGKQYLLNSENVANMSQKRDVSNFFYVLLLFSTEEGPYLSRGISHFTSLSGPDLTYLCKTIAGSNVPPRNLLSTVMDKNPAAFFTIDLYQFTISKLFSLMECSASTPLASLDESLFKKGWMTKKNDKMFAARVVSKDKTYSAKSPWTLCYDIEKKTLMFHTFGRPDMKQFLKFTASLLGTPEELPILSLSADIISLCKSNSLPYPSEQAERLFMVNDDADNKAFLKIYESPDTPARQKEVDKMTSKMGLSCTEAAMLNTVGLIYGKALELFRLPKNDLSFLLPITFPTDEAIDDTAILFADNWFSMAGGGTFLSSLDEYHMISGNTEDKTCNDILNRIESLWNKDCSISNDHTRHLAGDLLFQSLLQEGETALLARNYSVTVIGFCNFILDQINDFSKTGAEIHRFLAKRLSILGLVTLGKRPTSEEIENGMFEVTATPLLRKLLFLVGKRQG
jgi:hypothetical protein